MNKRWQQRGSYVQTLLSVKPAEKKKKKCSNIANRHEI